MTAKRKFDAGPATLTYTSHTNFLKRLGFTGTGFAHPTKKPVPIRHINGTSTVPTGSIWLIGFNVRRPARAAVSSPAHSATRAWANSCRESENKSTGSIRMSSGFSMEKEFTPRTIMQKVRKLLTAKRKACQPL